MCSSAAPIPFAGSMLREHRHVCAFFCSANDEYNTLLPFICDAWIAGTALSTCCLNGMSTIT